MTEELLDKANKLLKEIKQQEATITRLRNFTNPLTYNKVLLKIPYDSTMEYLIDQDSLKEIINFLITKHKLEVNKIQKEFDLL